MTETSPVTIGDPDSAIKFNQSRVHLLGSCSLPEINSDSEIQERPPVLRKIRTRASSGGEQTLLTRQQAASVLQITKRSVAKVLDSKYLSALTVDQITTLSKYPALLSPDQQPVLRQRIAQQAGQETLPRAWIGESANLTDSEVVDADSRWWRCSPDNIVHARFLPVTIAGFVVTVLHIHGLRDTATREWDSKQGRAGHEVRHAFEATLAARVRELGHPESNFVNPTLTPQEANHVRTILGGRSSAHSGGPIAYLPEH